MFEKCYVRLLDSGAQFFAPLKLATRSPLSRRAALACTAVWFVFVLIGFGSIVARAVAALHSPASHNTLIPVGATHTPDVHAPSTDIFIPTRLAIPSIGVDATVEKVTLASDGSMQTPSSFRTVGWYELGSMPGMAGSAVIDGHVNNALTSAGVFEHLDQVHLGDTLTVFDGTGRSRSFIVTSEQLYALGNAPTEEIFATGGVPQLVLITCDGAWDQGKKEFNERLVVYATLRA